MICNFTSKNKLNPDKKYFVQMINKHFNIEKTFSKYVVYKFAYQIKLQLNRHLKKLQIELDKQQTEKTA